MQSPGQPVMQSVVQPAADLDNQPVVQPATSEQTVTDPTENGHSVAEPVASIQPTTQPAVQAGECETGATVTQSAADLADQPVTQSAAGLADQPVT